MSTSQDITQLPPSHTAFIAPRTLLLHLCVHLSEELTVNAMNGLKISMLGKEIDKPIDSMDVTGKAELHGYECFI